MTHGRRSTGRAWIAGIFLALAYGGIALSDSRALGEVPSQVTASAHPTALPGADDGRTRTATARRAVLLRDHPRAPSFEDGSRLGPVDPEWRDAQEILPRPAAEQPQWTSYQRGCGGIVPGEVVVRFRHADIERPAQPWLDRLHATLLQTSPGLGLWRLKVPEEQELAVAEELGALASVAYAEPNFMLCRPQAPSASGSPDTSPAFFPILRPASSRSAAAPNDPLYEQQWGLRSANTPAAWDVTTGAPEVIVAVIDSGFDFGHPDQPINLLAGPNYVDRDQYPDDDDGHGTHVSGIISAAMNNATGVAGVAPGVSIAVVKALDREGRGTAADIASAIVWATDAALRRGGRPIINLSLGGPRPSRTLCDAVSHATSRGAIVVAAAGNEGTASVGYPAACPGALAVAATDRSGNRWASSSFGPQVALAAPGVAILSTWSPLAPRPWECSGKLYCTVSGTSMATPFVAAGAALTWSTHPELTADQVADILFTTASDQGPPGRDADFGWGSLDVGAAVTKGREISTGPRPIPPPPIGDQPGHLAGYVTQAPVRPLRPGGQLEVWVELTNSGSATWFRDGSHPVLLGTSRPEDRESAFHTPGKWPGSNRAARLEQASVPPGQVGTFRSVLTAPHSLGTYREYFRPVAEGQTWFNDLGLYFDLEVTDVAAPTYEAAFVRQSYPQQLSLGSQATVVVELRNVGTATWYRSGPNAVRLATSRPRDRSSPFYTPGSWLSPNRLAEPDEEAVPPGAVARFRFRLTAPTIPGAYREDFQLVADGLTWLNDEGMYFEIQVLKPAPTPTPTPALRATATPTPVRLSIAPITFGLGVVEERTCALSLTGKTFEYGAPELYARFDYGGAGKVEARWYRNEVRGAEPASFDVVGPSGCEWVSLYNPAGQLPSGTYRLDLVAQGRVLQSAAAVIQARALTPTPTRTPTPPPTPTPTPTPADAPVSTDLQIDSLAFGAGLLGGSSCLLSGVGSSFPYGIYRLYARFDYLDSGTLEAYWYRNGFLSAAPLTFTVPGPSGCDVVSLYNPWRPLFPGTYRLDLVADGRILRSATAAIRSDPPPSTPTPTRIPTRTPTAPPSATPTRTLVPTATPARTATPTRTPTPMPPKLP